ncbi:hypothetical protein [Paenibacillus sp. DYY-L-2]|uniref:hypothetical protein n=1 Tax=Paenibacillus sp. DYY-L-2 TaxID=3447013 RepID=UPI003F4F3F36
MLTVFRILFGKNTKIGDDLAAKGSSLSFFTLNNQTKQLSALYLYGQINDKAMT